MEKLILQFRSICKCWNFNFVKLLNYTISAPISWILKNRGWIVYISELYFPETSPGSVLNVVPSVYSGCVGNNMAASQGRLVGCRGLRCLLRTTNMQTAKSAISNRIGTKECRRTFFTSILRQGKAFPVEEAPQQFSAGWLVCLILPALIFPLISFFI